MGCKSSKNADSKPATAPPSAKSGGNANTNSSAAAKKQQASAAKQTPGPTEPIRDSVNIVSPSKPSSRLPAVKYTIDELERQLDRGDPPPPKATRAELQKYLQKFRILLTKEEEVPATPSQEELGLSNNAPLPPEETAPVRRQTISGKRTDISDATKFQPRVVPKDNTIRFALAGMVARYPTFAHLDDREIVTIVDAMVAKTFPSGTVVYKENDRADVQELFFVYTGSVSLQKGANTTVTTAGGVFGDIEVMGNLSRLNTAIATEATTCYALDEEHYRYMLAAGAHKKRERYVGWLEKIPWLKDLSRAQKIQLADALEARKFDKGEKLISYGVTGEWMYIIEEGTVEVWGYSAEHVPITDKAICSFKAGDCVGELEFIADDEKFRVTQADVVAATPVRAVRLNQRHFELCMGPIKDVLRDARNTLEKFEYYRNRLELSQKGKP